MSLTDREIFEAIKVVHGSHTAQSFMWQMKEWKDYRVTQRDEFAKAAITGTLPGRLISDTDVQAYADWAYRMADAMIAARGKGGAP